MNYFNLSDTSSEPFYKPKQDGGFFGLFGNDYSPLLFSAIEENNMSALSFLIKRPEIKSVKCKNKEGETILHILVKKCNIAGSQEVINSLLQRTDIKDFINVQDKKGNTALHIAVMNDCNELAQNLIKAGANPLIKNEAGFYIEDVEEEIKVNNASEKKSDIFIPTKSKMSDTEKKFLSNMIDSINTTSDAGGMTNMSITQTLKKDSKNFTDNLLVPEVSNTNTNYDTSDILNSILENKTVASESSVSITTPATPQNINTSEFIDRYLADKNTKEVLKGGKKTKKSKNLSNQSSYYTERSLSMSNSNLTSSVNIDSSESTEESSENSSSNEMSELSRMINNQATEIHERSVKKIMEIMGVSEQEARVIKAYIYSEIKSQSPELNNFDRAVEMEKRITKEHLSKLDKKKLKELSEVISEKQKQKESSSSAMTSESMTSSEESSSEEKPKKKKVAEKTKKSKKYF